MDSLTVGHKSLQVPAMVPSVSSFETNLRPIDAVELHRVLREPISLVSAYDVKQMGDALNIACEKFRETGILLLDSGGYEHSHVARYCGENAPSWSIDDFKVICELNNYDLAFSFDYFIGQAVPEETFSDFVSRFVDGVFGGHNFIPSKKLIPVLHLQPADRQRKPLTEHEILQFVTSILPHCKSPFIAIPERDLGEGIVERVILAQKICDRIKNAGVGLHILGCGNLLSFALMSMAGVKMADGLEWYRTLVADNFHLHHFQQEPLFSTAGESVENPQADLFLQEDIPYHLRVAILNLRSLQGFSQELTERLANRSVPEFVEKCFGPKAGTAAKALQS